MICVAVGASSTTLSEGTRREGHLRRGSQLVLPLAFFSRSFFSFLNRVRPATNFAFAVVRNNEFHITPVHATMQMRPCFDHIDAAKVRERCPKLLCGVRLTCHSVRVVLVRIRRCFFVSDRFDARGTTLG